MYIFDSFIGMSDCSFFTTLLLCIFLLLFFISFSNMLTFSIILFVVQVVGPLHSLCVCKGSATWCGPKATQWDIKALDARCRSHTYELVWDDGEYCPNISQVRVRIILFFKNILCVYVCVKTLFPVFPQSEKSYRRQRDQLLHLHLPMEPIRNTVRQW